ncbi:MAG: undecaprenyl-diphosphate phosphatase [Alphaproteobacteria bacterium]|nr:undecaprenyl-diphosphate phosphatase [Alphaproteobacteria bacterium]
MPLLQIAVLAVVQGITEFWPISSSAHLILTPVVFGWVDQGLAVDVAVHVGTMLAVIAYLHRDIWLVVPGVFELVRGRSSLGAQRAWHIIIGALPVIALGGVLQLSGAMTELRDPGLIGFTLLGFGVLLYLADRFGPHVLRLERMTARHALLIGLAQAVSLIPGTSRSGITITAARALGFERRESTRFSMLIALPAIAAAGILLGIEVAMSDDVMLGLDALAAGMVAFLTALVAIALMMRWLARATFTPFVVYRVVLGAGLLIWAYA